jgi:hypothetical protein
VLHVVEIGFFRETSLFWETDKAAIVIWHIGFGFEFLRFDLLVDQKPLQ